MSLFRPRILLSVVVLAVLGVAAAGAGWWFFVREDNQLATSAPEIPADLVEGATTPAADATAVDALPDDALTFRVIPERSEAAYFADETLASVGLPSTAKGATTEIEGEFHLTADGLALAEGATSSFEVQLATITSNEGRRDNRMREALEVTRYPSATFTVSSVTGYDPAIAEGEEQSLQLTGTLDLHGVQREVTWDVLARRQGDVFTALATLNFLYSDFKIPVLNIGGFVSVEDDVTLQIQIVAQAV
ncbi:MAG: YceI family protein [Dehalococcoidia bacterium]